jgi:hypothetical protein
MPLPRRAPFLVTNTEARRAAGVQRRARQAAEARRESIRDVMQLAAMPTGAVVAGVVLLLAQDPLGKALIATVVGTGVGYLVKLVMLIGAMAFSAVDSGYAEMYGDTLEERRMIRESGPGPSLGYVIYGWLLSIVPPLAAAASTLIVGAVLRGGRGPS